MSCEEEASSQETAAERNVGMGSVDPVRSAASGGRSAGGGGGVGG